MFFPGCNEGKVALFAPPPRPFVYLLYPDTNSRCWDCPGVKDRNFLWNLARSSVVMVDISDPNGRFSNTPGMFWGRREAQPLQDREGVW